ncbi:hypothetical protein IW139_003144 [Coemansia sp. RSA 353]|nr:hypothetical protein GGH15_003428 [Coemansia sp. RSA 562]KAJ2168819.1 hypothetical protein GGH16_003693 [Coemansia sp. RSA 560]KAJ2195428.1 hypothetical protein IW144_003462 [Coemansia sp. RSA 522]KAJ2204854.1 hypothetical protein IW145_003160 [Coemansia sp. RSA 521]KAJ2211935.1 hypothetical protein IW143_003973 [Coemansia sp. RSA 520]KAJ2296844.1 hypothetical protein IW139_003144 [Coemansia sp. RSA 353]KAJ2425973.1 hypothetical protein IWW41_004240 [Coemansia sp. RSA 2522]KAJ2642434.1 hy
MAVLYSPSRLHSVAVAEVCGVVAGHTPMRLTSPTTHIQTTKHISKHNRTLDILRTILGTTVLSEPIPSRQWDGELETKRLEFVDALRELQHPHAEAISDVHALLDNRVQLGLVSADAAREFSPCDTLADISPSSSLESASLGSEASMESEAPTVHEAPSAHETQTVHDMLDEAVRMRWRGRSISSDRTCVDMEPETDALGVCWPLRGACTRTGSGFYALLGEVRVPSRFRVPSHSLMMLASEQRMVASDKIVCPLKNRLQEVNPKRQGFEDYVRATGCIPPVPVRQHSRLRHPC